jgi:cysteinyl-tRNA synthetase
LEKPPEALAQAYIDAFYEDMGRLDVLKADREPRATEHIDGMIRMIKALLDGGHAYAADGEVYFSVESYGGYGDLSGRKLDDMEAGSRIAVDDKKRHPMDFVLWKPAKPGEPRWESPWGPGRPGWHMECSVMSNHFLGPSFDIHGGGRDLLFPHHENERAQSVCANGGRFAAYWVHNGFVTVESEKMSKSLGNFLTIRDALDSYQPEVLRLFLLSKHYRSPLDFTDAGVSALQSGLARIYRTRQRLDDLIGPPEPADAVPDATPFLSDKVLSGGRGEDPFMDRFIHTLDDDLNTAGAIGLVFDKIREMNRIMDAESDGLDDAARAGLSRDRTMVSLAGRVLGLFGQDPEAFFSALADGAAEVDPAEVEAMIRERTDARTARDWARADGIRDRLKDMGVVLEDGPEGTTWRLDV